MRRREKRSEVREEVEEERRENISGKGNQGGGGERKGEKG